jgi:hypothetical protein
MWVPGGVTYDGSRTHMRQELRGLKKKKKNRLRGMFVILFTRSLSLSLSLSRMCIYIYIYAGKELRKVAMSVKNVYIERRD